jgi:nitric oxide reductase activation protein
MSTTKRARVKKPNNVRQVEEVMPVVKAQPTITQRIVLAWLDRAAMLNIVPSQKKYKEAQLEFMLDLASKMGAQFPNEILECIQDNKDTAILIRGRKDG